jgi:hypothetical protein
LSQPAEEEIERKIAAGWRQEAISLIIFSSDLILIQQEINEKELDQDKRSEIENIMLWELFGRDYIGGGM